MPLIKAIDGHVEVESVDQDQLFESAILVEGIIIMRNTSLKLF